MRHPLHELYNPYLLDNTRSQASKTRLLAAQLLKAAAGHNPGILVRIVFGVQRLAGYWI